MIKLDPKEVEELEASVAKWRALGDGGEYLGERLKDLYRAYTEYKIKLKTDIYNSKLQYNTNYLWTRYQIAKKYNKELLEKELTEDPQKALEIRTAKLEKEKAEKAKLALDQGDQVALLNEVAKAAADTDSEKAIADLMKKKDTDVKDALQAVKDAARNRDMSKSEKQKLKDAAELAQKKYLALKTEVKKEDDKRAAALEMAKE